MAYNLLWQEQQRNQRQREQELQEQQQPQQQAYYQPLEESGNGNVNVPVPVSNDVEDKKNEDYNKRVTMAGYGILCGVCGYVFASAFDKNPLECIAVGALGGCACGMISQHKVQYKSEKRVDRNGNEVEKVTGKKSSEASEWRKTIVASFFAWHLAPVVITGGLLIGGVALIGLSRRR